MRSAITPSLGVLFSVVALSGMSLGCGPAPAPETQASPTLSEPSSNAPSAAPEAGAVQPAPPAGARPPAVAEPGEPNKTLAALSELNLLDAKRLEKLIATRAACKDVCAALETQLDSKRVLCDAGGQASSACDKALQRLGPSATRAKQSRCKCAAVPEDELAEQPSS